MNVFTERLLLRPMTVEDAGIVVSWRNQPRIRQVLETESDDFLTLESHLRWFGATREERVDYVVCFKDAERPIGVWSFKPAIYQAVDRCMEQGRYIGDEEALGKGYAKEAATAWIYFGFQHLNLDAIVSIHKTDNEVPQKINLKFGFQYYGQDEVDERFRRMVLTREGFERLDRSLWANITVKT